MEDKAVVVVNGKEFFVDKGCSLMDICEDAGIPIACGEGFCGACRIRVIDGMENLSKMTAEEEDYFGDVDGEERLACKCDVLGGRVDIEV